jgi:hypothetical protein
MFRTVPLSIIRSFSLYTQQRYMSYNLLTACDQDQDGTQFHPDPSRKLSANCMTYTVAVCTVKNCPKHVEFHSKNKFEKLVHHVGFIKINLIVRYLRPVMDVLDSQMFCTFG